MFISSVQRSVARVTSLLTYLIKKNNINFQFYWNLGLFLVSRYLSCKLVSIVVNKKSSKIKIFKKIFYRILEFIKKKVIEFSENISF